MIEITHKQAQRLIRETQDRQIPDESWAVLQAHLESCPECRAYLHRLETYERDMRRSLLHRWSNAVGPRKGIAESILQRRERWLERRRRFRSALPWLLVGLFLVGYISYRRVMAPEPLPPPTQVPVIVPFDPTTQAASATATAQALAHTSFAFRGLLLFSAPEQGSSEIFLMNFSPSGSELTDLTNNPAQDTFPAWSPDGQWIAFLSDRDGGNPEIYVETVAGSRVTRLTADPLILWRGPLAWRYDGSGILAAGSSVGGDPAGQGASRLYLVPMDGTPPQSLAYTYNFSGAFRPSPNTPVVAYQDSALQGGLRFLDLLTGWISSLTQEENHMLSLSASTAFDWLFGGSRIVYTAFGPLDPRTGEPRMGAQTSVHISREIDPNLAFTVISGSQISDTLEEGKEIRALTGVPNSLLVAELVDTSGGGQTPCWTVRLSNSLNIEWAGRELNGLCITGELGAGNWTPDGKWLVVRARPPQEKDSAVYAIAMPEDLTRQDTAASPALAFEKLAAQDFEPLVRPTGRLLSISPRPASPPVARPVPLDPPTGAPGTIVFTQQVKLANGGASTQILRVLPSRLPVGNNQGGALMGLADNLAADGVEIRCPRISPDGKRVAFLYQRKLVPPRMGELMLVGVDGSDLRPLTATPSDPLTGMTGDPPLLRYDCPVWSPDSKRLVAALRGAENDYLAVIPADQEGAGQGVKYLQVEKLSSLSEPVWLPKFDKISPMGGDTVLLVYKQDGQPVRLVAVDVDRSIDQQPASGAERLVLSGWSDLEGLALSQDGRVLAGLSMYSSSQAGSLSGTVIEQLRLISTDTYNVVDALNPGNHNLYTAQLTALTWLPRGQLALAQGTSLVGPQKTLFQTYNIGERPGRLNTIASFEDVITRAAWTKDGRYLAFASESGLYVLDPAQPGRAPARIVEGGVLDLDWK